MQNDVQTPPKHRWRIYVVVSSPGLVCESELQSQDAYSSDAVLQLEWAGLW